MNKKNNDRFGENLKLGSPRSEEFGSDDEDMPLTRDDI